MSCETCPGKWAIKTKVESYGPTTAKIIIVGEAPGASEVGSGRPFVGRSGKYLANKLNDIGIDVKDIRLVNACKCFISDPSVKILEACKEYLKADVESCKDKQVILALGAKALKALVPKEAKGILANSGKTFWSEELGCKILACIHPAAVLRNPRLDALFKESLSRLKKAQFVFKDFKTIRANSVDELAKLIPAGSTVAIDTETTGLDYLAENFAITDVGFFDGEKAVICKGDIINEPMFASLFQTYKGIYHNGSYDIKALRSTTGHWFKVTDDTMLMGFAHNESFGSSEDTGYGLERLAMLYLNAEPWKANMKAKNFKCSDEEMDRYLSLDVYYTYNLWKMWKDSWNSEGLKKFYTDLLIPAVNAKSKMEYGGINQDTGLVNEMTKFAKKRIVSLVKAMRTMIKKPNYNPNSGPQNLALFKKLLGSKVKTTDKDVVNANLDKPFFRVLLRYRKLSKQISTFLTNKHVGTDGHVHTNFRIHGTETGRISSSQPNIQNIPSYCRRIYIPDAEHTWWVDCDYDQLEMKLIIVLAGLKDVIEQINNGYDLHTITSLLMTGKDNPKDVLKIERVRAKGVNFGCLYGATDEKIASMLSTKERTWTLAEAKTFKNKYVFTRPDLEEWKARLIADAMKKRFVETEFGSRRRFGLITRENYAETCRLIVNTKIQGTAGQMCLSRVVELVDAIPKQFNARVINTIHDQICCSCKDGEEKELAAYMKEVMEKPFHFSDFVFTGSPSINRRWK